MNYITKKSEHLDIEVKISFFKPVNEVNESHVILSYTDVNIKEPNDFSTQLKDLNKYLDEIINEYFDNEVLICFKRYFLSDIVNQVDFVKQQEESSYYPFSVVQQPHLPGSKAAIWVYLVSYDNIDNMKTPHFNFHHNGYSHLWLTQLHDSQAGVFKQTEAIFKKMDKVFDTFNCSLKNNCIRTWLFIRDIDLYYKEATDARNLYFDSIGLTADTHFIASTGIEGRYSLPGTGVIIDAYMIKGLQPEQIKFLRGSSNMNPTHQYGVAFERGTAVDYGDRRHVFISGTASINNKGEIVAPGDIIKQTERTLENVTVLLEEAGAGLSDLAQLIVYLRDLTDYPIVNGLLESKCPAIPYLILLAPVCRPGWLIEFEGIAIVQHEKKGFRNF